MANEINQANVERRVCSKFEENQIIIAMYRAHIHTHTEMKVLETCSGDQGQRECHGPKSEYYQSYTKNIIESWF